MTDQPVARSDTPARSDTSAPPDTPAQQDTPAQHGHSPDEPAHRQTRQREAVRSIMATLTQFRSAQEVHDILRDRGQPIGLATVYRTLAAMADTGEVDAIRTPEGLLIYRRCSPEHHHHLICRECGRTVEIALPNLERCLAAVAADHGFTDLDHSIDLYGRCSDCRPEATDRTGTS